MRFDLHVHSCLSPCGDLEMSLRAIVARAVAVGLDALAIADHNSARNAPALAECCRDAGLSCLFGLEVNTAEELHALTVFDTLEQAGEMTEWIYESLPRRVNQPEVFGDQPVVTADETIVELEWRLLSAPSRRTLREIGAQTHRLGGLFIACHVDRPVFSVFSQLGVLSGDEGFDAMELSRSADAAAWLAKIGPHALIRSSDAHYLADLGTAWSEADLDGFTTAGLRDAFRRRSIRLSAAWSRG
jgi:PHP family Zn ribbon phosphoesterase